MRKLILLLIPLGLQYTADAQGCVAIRSNGAVCTMTGPHDETSAKSSKWTIGLNSRYFKSFRHFVGKDEQEHRMEEKSEVINYTFSTELGIVRQVNNRISLGFYAPITSNVRSSKYEHYGNNSTDPDARASTQSFGLGDVRLAAYYWLTNPAKNRPLNIQLGLGVKLPTGDYQYMDHFYKTDSTKLLGPVDQSIQLGDGGTGITAELNIFYNIYKGLGVYANGYYLLNPREHNGVSTSRGGPQSATNIAYGTDVMSVPDQYMIRGGASLGLKQWHISAGMRMECVPAEDLVGGSMGFRRPGYVLSVEPVVAYRIKRTQLYLSVPYAVERNRVQSVGDKLRTQKTGVFAQGDAAFADYSINFGISVSL
jgi:hypothetical protein